VRRIRQRLVAHDAHSLGSFDPSGEGREPRGGVGHVPTAVGSDPRVLHVAASLRERVDASVAREVAEQQHAGLRRIFRQRERELRQDARDQLIERVELGTPPRALAIELGKRQAPGRALVESQPLATPRVLAERLFAPLARFRLELPVRREPGQPAEPSHARPPLVSKRERGAALAQQLLDQQAGDRRAPLAGARAHLERQRAHQLTDPLVRTLERDDRVCAPSEADQRPRAPELGVGTRLPGVVQARPELVVEL
jgi:hypothetical protein